VPRCSEIERLKEWKGGCVPAADRRLTLLADGRILRWVRIVKDAKPKTQIRGGLEEKALDADGEAT
jgi:hypothetical protein